MRKELVVNGKNIEYEVHSVSDGELEIHFSGEQFLVKKLAQKGNELYLQTNKRIRKIALAETAKAFYADIDGNSYELKLKEKKIQARASEAERSMCTPMPGKVLRVLVEVGESVLAGDPLVIMEAMKMEHTLVSNKDAIVEEVLFKEGDLVEEGVELIHLKEKNVSKKS